MTLKHLLLSLVLLAALCPGAKSETLYRWKDSEGELRVTRSQPDLGVTYTTIEVPDAIRWSNPSEMPGEVVAGTESSTQSFFKAGSQSVYGLTGKLRNNMGRSHGMTFGSAVAIGEKLAITNCHVLKDAGDEIYLAASGAEESEQARLVGADYTADRCVISVSRMTLHPIPGIRRFETLEVGETVYAIGNPLKLDRTLSQGLLSGKREIGERRYLQTTAPISPGSSGGGLFDIHGNLIGITSFTLSGAQSLNFAIPAEDFWH